MLIIKKTLTFFALVSFLIIGLAVTTQDVLAQTVDINYIGGSNDGSLLVDVRAVTSPPGIILDPFHYVSWFMGGAGVTGIAPSPDQIIYTYNSPGTYTITIELWNDPDADPNTPNHFILDTDTLGVNVASRVVDFTATPNGGNPQQIDFVATINGGDPPGAETWSWDFGDTFTGSGRVVSHTYTAGGNYTVNLDVNLPQYLVSGFPPPSGMLYGRTKAVTVAVAAQFSADPNPVAFGDVAIGSSKNQNVCMKGSGGITLANPAPPINITGANFDEFSHNNPWPVGTSLGNLCNNFQVTFTPKIPNGSKTAVLNFNTSEGLKTINITGNATGGGCGNFPTACTVANQATTCCSQVCSVGQCAGRVGFIGQVGGNPCPGICSGPAPLVVTFVDDPAVQGTFAEDVPGSQNWSWDIPGGATPSPTSGGDLPISPITVTYGTPGTTHDVRLNLFGSYANFQERLGYIKVTGVGSSAPTANFTMNKGGAAIPGPGEPVNVNDTVNFVDFSICFDSPNPCVPNNVITSSEWNFGDGVIMPCLPSCSPSHTFTNPGLHNITLSVTDGDNESNNITKQINVQGGPPITGSVVINRMNPADIVGAAVTASSNVRLDFTCDAGGLPCTQMKISNILPPDWGPIASVPFAPFMDPWGLVAVPDGQKAVFVRFTENGTDWSSIYSDTIILSTSSPTACFNVTVNNFQVNFNSSCSTPGGSPPIQGWEWNFGDGQTLVCVPPVPCTPIQQNPNHTYSPPKGNRTVTLTITDNAGVESQPFAKTFFVGPPTLGFILDFPNILEADTAEEIIDAIINLLAWIIIPLAVLLIIYAAFRYMIAGAIPAERAKAIQIIQYALIGIVVVIMAKVIKGLIEFLLT